MENTKSELDSLKAKLFIISGSQATNIPTIGIMIACGVSYYIKYTCIK